MTGFFASPSGRRSMRRALFALAVVVALVCAVLSVVMSRDIQPGAVSVLATAIAATATAATAGRFAERGSEPQKVEA